MDVLVTCKNEGKTIKNKSARVVTTLLIIFSDAQGLSGVSIGVCCKFELIQAFIHVLVTFKNKDDSIKNEWAIFPL